ncbi:MAG: glutaredoxin family protein [Thermomicrobiales bacterium]
MLDVTGCTIVLYTQTGCHDTDPIRNWLNANAIPFSERNVMTSEEALNELLHTGIFVTPLTTVCGRPYAGKKASALEEMIVSCPKRRAT